MCFCVHLKGCVEFADIIRPQQNFLKANLHCHSTYSDGELTVDELKDKYVKRGYSIVAFTDHEHIIDNSRLTDENFIAITSCELAIKEFPNEFVLTENTKEYILQKA